LQGSESRRRDFDLASVRADESRHRLLPLGGDPGKLFAQLEQLVLFGRVGAEYRDTL